MQLLQVKPLQHKDKSAEKESPQKVMVSLVSNQKPATQPLNQSPAKELVNKEAVTTHSFDVVTPGKDGSDSKETVSSPPVSEDKKINSPSPNPVRGTVIPSADTASSQGNIPSPPTPTRKTVDMIPDSKPGRRPLQTAGVDIQPGHIRERQFQELGEASLMKPAVKNRKVRLIVAYLHVLTYNTCIFTYLHTYSSY